MYLRAIASSDDGVKLVLASLFGRLYTSTNSGATWVARETDRAWADVASSGNGKTLVAVAGRDLMGASGRIHVSTDSGVSWTPRGSSQYDFTSVAASRDGVTLLATSQGLGDKFSEGRLFTSSNSGVTWVASGEKNAWLTSASSSDGKKLFAAASTGSIYTSVLKGSGLRNWTPTASGKASWTGVASSDDGTKLAAITLSDAKITVSSDSGKIPTEWHSNRYM